MQVTKNQLPKVKFPKKMRALFEKARFKVFYGGRGGGKSVSIAIALLLLGMLGKEKILCTREVQNSIDDSVHAVLKEQIDILGIGWFYEVQKNKIIGLNGTEFIFAGLHGRTIGSVKSKQGITKVWVEEAQYISDKSFDILFPTIREEGSECWISFNPELDSDPVWVRFIENPPPDAIVVKINWYDNPFISKTLLDQKDEDYRRNPENARYIWEGFCKASIDGAIYKDEMEFIVSANRIIELPHEPLLRVNTYWDLGKRDATAIWFIQHAQGEEHRVIDYYENTGKELKHYAEVALSKGYDYDEHYLPHDVMVSELMSTMTRFDALQTYGLSNIIAVPRVREIETGIEATRQLLKNCWFDKEKCKKGLHALKSYQYEYDDKLKAYKRDKPLHNWASNGADAFRQFAQSWTPTQNETIPLDDAPMDWWQY